MKMMKKVLVATLAAAMAVSVIGCSGNGNSGSSGSGDDSVQKIKDKGELVMLTNPAFPPFEYMDGDTVKGVDVDIAQAIADEMGVKLKVQSMDFDPIVDFIKSGKGDLGLAGITVNEKRQKAVDFSENYVTTSQYIIVKNDVDEKSFDPNGKIAGVQQGTTGDTYYASDEEVMKPSKVNRYKSAVDAVEDLKLGRVDFVIIDELPAKKLAEKNDAVKCYDPGYDKEQYAIAMAKDSPELKALVNKVLKKLADEGKIDEALVKHTSNS